MLKLCREINVRQQGVNKSCQIRGQIPALRAEFRSSGEYSFGF
jgi:hypothetical protein